MGAQFTSASQRFIEQEQPISYGVVPTAWPQDVRSITFELSYSEFGSDDLSEARSVSEKSGFVRVDTAGSGRLLFETTPEVYENLLDQLAKGSRMTASALQNRFPDEVLAVSFRQEDSLFVLATLDCGRGVSDGLNTDGTLQRSYQVFRTVYMQANHMRASEQLDPQLLEPPSIAFECRTESELN